MRRLGMFFVFSWAMKMGIRIHDLHAKSSDVNDGGCVSEVSEENIPRNR